MKRLVKRFSSSLRYKMAGLMLLLSLGSLAVISVITLILLLGQLTGFSDRLNEAETILRSNVVGRNLTAAAADTVVDIDTYLLERIEDVRRWSEEASLVQAARLGSLAATQAGMSGLASDPQAAQTKLGGSLFIPIDSAAFTPALSYVFAQTERPETPFLSILVTEKNGINVLVTRPEERVVHADEAWWQAAANPNLAGIGITPVQMDQASGKPVIGIALPILDSDSKEIVGVIQARVQLEELRRRLAQKAIQLDAVIQVINPEGLEIIDSSSGNDPQKILKDDVNLVRMGYEPAKAALSARAGSDGAGVTFVSGVNQSQIVGYAQTGDSLFYDTPAGLSGFQGFGWGVLVSQPEQRALLVLRNLIQTGAAFQHLPIQLGQSFGIATILIAIASLSGAIFFSGSITRPLVNLNRMSRRVQDGDLETQVEITSQDEVGELGRAFNLMTEGLRQRERERDIFGRVVTPEVREKLLSGKLELGGETRCVSVLFSDIRNFSTIAEKTEPQALIAFLNEYLTAMSQAIQPWGGYLNNFIGDAVVAIFGAPINQPDQEWKAVSAAIHMRKNLAALNQLRIDRGEEPINSGIGISTGEAVAGQIGSLERLMYTVIGDVVNVAARLESLTKEYPHYPILINQATAQAIQGRAGINLLRLGEIPVKGRSEPVEVFAVLV